MASYLVLARKYRPQLFADLTGQEHVAQTLTNALKSGRVAHALLFCGPRGCGKTTTARILAKALNCARARTADQPEGALVEPCGECTPCREITAGTDVDVQEIDAASNTGVDNVRELRESAKYLPAHDRYKIFIVDEVHMLSKAAFNAFLKTLEEPPGHVKFLFATTDPQALPDTILSRCQRHNFRLVPLKQIAERIRAIALAEKVTIDDGAVALVARQAAGSMRDALSLLDQVFSSCGAGAPISAADAAQALGALDLGVVSQLAGSLLARDAKGALEGVAQAYDGGHDLKRLTEDLATHLRNLLAASVAGAPLDLPDHELKALREQAAHSDPLELARLFDLVHGALYELSRAAQPRHALEIALLRTIYLAPSTSVQSLLARADELTRRLGGEPPPPTPGGGRAPSGPGPARPRPAAFDAPAGSTLRAVPSPGPRQEATPAHGVVASDQRNEAAPVPTLVEPPKLPDPVVVVPQIAVVPQINPAPPVISVPAPVVVAAPPPPPAPRLVPPVGTPWDRRLTLVPPEATAAKVIAAPVLSLAPEPAPPPAAAPPPAPPPVAVPQPLRLVADGALGARWPALVESIRGRKKMLGSMLEHARPLSLANDELSLGFLKGDLAAQSVAGEKLTLEAIFSELLASPVRLNVVELQAGQGTAIASLAESNDRADREAREARLKAGREHPAVQRAASLLGAEIEDVRDLGGAIS